jgi:hypothetical protein
MFYGSAIQNPSTVSLYKRETLQRQSLAEFPQLVPYNPDRVPNPVRILSPGYETPVS